MYFFIINKRYTLWAMQMSQNSQFFCTKRKIYVKALFTKYFPSVGYSRMLNMIQQEHWLILSSRLYQASKGFSSALSLSCRVLHTGIRSPGSAKCCQGKIHGMTVNCFCFLTLRLLGINWWAYLVQLVRRSTQVRTSGGSVWSASPSQRVAWRAHSIKHDPGT